MENVIIPELDDSIQELKEVSNNLFLVKNSLAADQCPDLSVADDALWVVVKNLERIAADLNRIQRGLQKGAAE